jgi:hypothetical protein
VALRGALSDERFQRYLDASGSEADALRLYVWNAAVSAAFYGPLQAVEITLRNTVHRSLGSAYGQRWFENSRLLKPGELRIARDAREALKRVGKVATPGRVVAELSFSFWVGLFANAYDNTAWRLQLCHAFSPRPPRNQLYERLDRLRTLRNRIAHHEPIFQRKLLDDYQRVLDVLDRLSKPVKEWVDHHSRVFETIGRAELDTERF